VSRRTENDEARDLLAELGKRGFHLCEQVPKDDAHYLEGADAKEWRPIDDKRAVKVVAMLILSLVD
jgi:hypothetical protein